MVNKTVFQGRLTKDIEIKKTQGDIPYCNFTVAWSEKYKENEIKCFLPCKAWRMTADFLGKYFQKGSELVVEGRLVTEQWQDKDGNNQSRILLDVEKAHFAGSKKDSAGNAGKDTVLDVNEADLPF